MTIVGLLCGADDWIALFYVLNARKTGSGNTSSYPVVFHHTTHLTEFIRSLIRQNFEICLPGGLKIC